jgi:hypothetical protein
MGLKRPFKENAMALVAFVTQFTSLIVAAPPA